MPLPPTDNMQLILPIVSVDTGPAWAELINQAMERIDNHDHSTGLGVPIDAGSIDINQNLNLKGFNLIQTTAVGFVGIPLSSGALPVTNQKFLYVFNNELYYNDSNNHQVQITINGVINSPTTPIPGLTGNAQIFYNNTTKTFEFRQDSTTNTYANMDFAGLKLRGPGASPPALTLGPPASMAASYSLVLPSLPTGSSFVILASNGIMSTTLLTDLQTLIGPTTADAIAATMTSTGANAIALDMTSTGSNAIAASMNSTGTGSIVATMTAANANTIASKFTQTGTASISSTMSTADANTIGNKMTSINKFLKVNNVPALPLATSNNSLGRVMGIVAGAVNAGGGIVWGEGFNCIQQSNGVYAITFTQPFATNPVITAMNMNFDTIQAVQVIVNCPSPLISANGFTIVTYSQDAHFGSNFMFHAIGLVY